MKRVLFVFFSMLMGVDTVAESTNDVLVIDVRTMQEWNQGHLASAERVEWQDIHSVIGALASSIDKHIVVYCRSGQRSGKAKEILDAMGYTHVTNAGSLSEASDLLKESIVQ